MKRTTAIHAAGLFLLVMMALYVPGQKRLLSAREIDEKFSQVWKSGLATRPNYTWKAKTEVIREDKTVQVLVEEVSCGPDGRQVSRVISNQEAPLPSTIFIRQIAEDQKAKVVDFMKRLRAFLERYALTDDSLRHSFFSRASIGLADANGQLLVSGTSVLTKGDRLNWWLETSLYSLTTATISTTFESYAVEFSATYGLLPGLNYMSQARITVPAKNTVVKLLFYDYVKR